MGPRRGRSGRSTLAVSTMLFAGALLSTSCGAQSSLSAGDPITSQSPTSAPERGPVSTGAPVSSEAGVPCPPSRLDAPPIPGGLPATKFPCLGPGPEVNLAGLRGRPVVLNVWASWCPPCREEMPLFTDLAADAGDSLVVLGVDVEDDPQTAAEYAAEVGLASVIDEKSMTRVTLGWNGPPVTYFVRADGTIAHRAFGAIPDAQTLRALVSTHLGVEVGDG